MDTSFDVCVGGFDTSFSGNSQFYEITENQFLNSTGTTISAEDSKIDTTRYVDNEVELSEKILEMKSEFTQRTSTTGFVDMVLHELRVFQNFYQLKLYHTIHSHLKLHSSPIHIMNIHLIQYTKTIIKFFHQLWFFWIHLQFNKLLFVVNKSCPLKLKNRFEQC